MTASKTAESFKSLYDTIARLRAPDGCPWDIEQTPLSMRSSIIEECFEAVDAITQNDVLHAKEELGDILLNAVLVSYMYEQNGDFTVSSVLEEVVQKLIRRHPHVFPESEGKSESIGAKTAEQVLTQWDAIKNSVEKRKTTNTLDEVSKGLSPLLRAYKLQKKAAKKGFDWKHVSPVLEKVREEIAEIEEEIAKEPQKNQLKIEEEIGDLLFAVVNVCRHLHVEPETALSRANQKFYNRFSYVEQQMNKAQIPLINENLAQMDLFWEKSKELE